MALRESRTWYEIIVVQVFGINGIVADAETREVVIETDLTGLERG